MKNNIDYYSHYAASDQHPKFKMLRVKYGWEGEGRFWALNNRIALADNCTLDLTKPYNKATLASDIGMTMDELDEFLDYLISDCGLIKEVNSGLTNDIIQDILADIQEKRKSSRERRRRNRKHGDGSPKQQKSSPEPLDKVKESKVKEIRAIVDHLNLKSGKQYKPDTEKTKSFITARLNDGFTVDDFKRVIDTKCAQWKDDREWNMYLRPETLFSNKFEGYLNQKVSKPKRRLAY